MNIENLRGVDNLVSCIKISLKDGRSVQLTTADCEISLLDGIYLPGLCKHSSIVISAVMAADNFDFEVMLSALNLSSEQLIEGALFQSKVEISIIKLTKADSVKIFSKVGYVANTRSVNDKLIFEVRGVSDFMNFSLTENYSNSCRAKFGDHRCRINTDDYTFDGVVTEVLNNCSFMAEINQTREASLSGGIITFAQGGGSMYVQSYLDKKIIMTNSLNFKIKKGDDFKIRASCDKSLSSCVEVFNNALNFRGEPYIPIPEKL